MNYIGNKAFIYIFFLYVGCAPIDVGTKPDVTLTPLNSASIQSTNYMLSLEYNGLRSLNHEFKVYIGNKSENPIFINPDLFRYSFTSDFNKTDTVIYSIRPDERIAQLKIQGDSLKNEENPYSLTNKSIKEIALDGLAQGTVAVFFGQNAEELEMQRLDNEHDWEERFSIKLNEINKELDFWNNSALLPAMIPPKNVVEGKVLFPNSATVKEIVLSIPIQEVLYKFKFTQSP